MTPAEQRGMVIGKAYRYASKSGKGWPELEGRIVTYKRDDGTEIPVFDVPADVEANGWAYLDLANIHEINAGEKAPAFSVEVGNGKTTITVSTELTAAQVARVLAEAGIK